MRESPNVWGMRLTGGLIAGCSLSLAKSRSLALLRIPRSLIHIAWEGPHPALRATLSHADAGEGFFSFYSSDGRRRG